MHNQNVWYVDHFPLILSLAEKPASVICQPSRFSSLDIEKVMQVLVCLGVGLYSAILENTEHSNLQLQVKKVVCVANKTAKAK